MEHDYDPKDPEGHEAKEEFQKIRDQYKVPFACHACNKLMYNFDEKPFYQYGVCQECHIFYIADRDLSEEFLRDRPGLLTYVKEKIEEKEEKNLNIVENK